MPRKMWWLWNSTGIMIGHKTQWVPTRAFTRLIVTTCLYLSPSDRARSLSTLIAVIVDEDTPQNIETVIKKSKEEKKQTLECSGAIRKIQKRGCVIRPTHKSVQARQLSKSFDGGWRHDTFRRAMMIKRFPIIAKMDEGRFIVKMNIFWAVPRPGEQENPRPVVV